MPAEAIDRMIEGYEKDMVETLSDMIAIKAVSPESGGYGEGRRADFLEGALKGMGARCRRIEYKDGSGTMRPNLVCTHGKGNRTLWIVAHTDTVAEGDASLWKTDPFKARVSDGKVYGRGSSDNGQGVISAIYAMKALRESGADTKYRVGIALVADEELGSRYGIQKLIGDNVFGNDDLFLVPDWGTPRGDRIEIAEKGMLWLKVTVHGKQVHASVPDTGVNAYRYGSMLALELERRFRKRFGARDAIFEPAHSTFEMTKHEKNVDSVNIIPGTDVFYIDCRALPRYSLDDVLREASRVSGERNFRKARIEIETYSRVDAAQPTSKDSELVLLLKNAVKDVKGITPGVTGIGGGTCASFFRKMGMDAAVWSTLEDTAHQPNEYARIKDMVGDTKAIARLCLA